MPAWWTPRTLLIGAAVLLVIAERGYAAWRRNAGRRLRKRWREGPPTDAEPDFVWLVPGADANGMVTWCGDLYEVCEEDFDPAPRPATTGPLTSEQADALATWSETSLRMSRTAPGDVRFARVVRGDGPSSGQAWRVEALTRSDDALTYDFGTESEARAFVDLFERRMYPPSGDPARGDDAQLDRALAAERAEADAAPAVAR